MGWSDIREKTVHTSKIQSKFQFWGKRYINSRILCDMVQNYGVGTIAIGNGTGCRETQELVSYAIEAGRFNPVKVR